ncbi:hypothetical protein FJZ17_01670 [Candidatus Pacearchaeota archaeon]|nr:hypothetical protein [Candidatus Pacearchaeota archaeon]
MDERNQKPNLKQILQALPIISEQELRAGSKRFPAIHVAIVTVNYPLTGLEVKTGLVFGTNENRTALYLSRDGLGEEANFCNLGEPFIETHYIKKYEILKEFKLLKIK